MILLISTVSFLGLVGVCCLVNWTIKIVKAQTR